MNGDVKSVRAYLEKAIPPSICKLTDIKVNGGQVIYTSACGGGTANVVTTTYHGDRSEGSSTGGAKTEAKWVGACKSRPQSARGPLALASERRAMRSDPPKGYSRPPRV